MNQFDAIIIGSGMSGLTLGSLLAQVSKKRVLILEQHFKPGGYTHTFSRGKYTWDVGLHYVGEVGEGSIGRKLFDFISGGSLSWKKLTSPIDRFYFPGMTFDQPDNGTDFEKSLILRFPQEKYAIENYFKIIKEIGPLVPLKALSNVDSTFKNILLNFPDCNDLLSPDLSTRDYFAKNFHNPDLINILTAQWGNYGLPPESSPFFLHAALANHYLDGAFYPQGGSEEIAHTVINVIKSVGGEVITSAKVQSLNIEGNKVKDVNVLIKENLQTFSAPLVISSIGAINTYQNLIPRDYPLDFNIPSDQILKSSVLCNFIKLSDDPQKLGVNQENHWVYTNENYNDIFKHQQLPKGLLFPAQCFVSFPSKKLGSPYHTAEIISFANYGHFSPWENAQWKRRGPEYENFKSKIQASLNDLVEAHIPGFKNLISYQELATPVSYCYFSNMPNGEIYGLPFDPRKFTDAPPPWLTPKTPIAGLFQTGVDTFTPGIMGALMSGFITAAAVDPGINIARFWR